MTVDPGYGNAAAPIGSVEWAKYWRLHFQGFVKDLEKVPKDNADYYQIGRKYAAWSLLTDETGKTFPTWETFCSYRQPYGLGVDPALFRLHVAPIIGEKAFDLLTVKPGTDVGGRPKKGEETGDAMSPVSAAGQRKAKRLRAILRAPEIVQDLYREGRIAQAVAAKLGPKSPTPEKAATIAEVRQELEKLDRSQPEREFRRAAAQVVQGKLGGGVSALDQARRWIARLTAEEREILLRELQL